MKKFFIFFSLAIITTIGIYTMVTVSKLDRTYNGKNTNVYEIAQNPEKYSIGEEDGIASIIVKENLDKTHALNAVSAIVFDFRGYDTLGESFILLTAISGTVAILKRSSKEGRDKNE